MLGEPAGVAVRGGARTARAARRDAGTGVLTGPRAPVRRRERLRLGALAPQRGPPGTRLVEELRQRGGATRGGRRVVERHDEVVARPGRRHVAEPELLGALEELLLLGEAGEAEGPALLVHVDLEAAPSRRQHGRPCGRGPGPAAQLGHDHEGELEALRAVDRHDLNGVLVVLRRRKLHRADLILCLQVHPDQQLGHAGAARLDERARLVEDEADAAQRLQVPPAPRRELEHVAVAHQRLEGRDGAGGAAAGREGTELAERSGDGVLRPRSGRDVPVEAPRAAGPAPGEEVVVAAAEVRGPERRDDRRAVRRRAHRPQTGDEVADLGRLVDEGRRAHPVGHVRAVERLLELGEARPARHQDGDVAVARRARATVPLDRPALAHRPGDGRRDRLRLAPATLAGTLALVGRTAEDDDGGVRRPARPPPGRAPRRPAPERRPPRRP